MEPEIVLGGIGGQGVQLAAKTLATAAMRAGMKVLMFGTYSGVMRGGETDATVVVGRGSLVTPPVIDSCWGAIAMHPSRWARIGQMLQPGGVALVDTTVFEERVTFDGTVIELRATGLAADAGMPQACSMVALGAFCAATGLVGLEALESVCEEVLPPYRRQFAATNREALRLGYGAVPHGTVPAWQGEPA